LGQLDHISAYLFFVHFVPHMNYPVSVVRLNNPYETTWGSEISYAFGRY